MFVIDVGRFAGDRLLIEHDLLGIAATADAHNAEQFITNFELRRLGTALLNATGDVASECIGQPVPP